MLIGTVRMRLRRCAAILVSLLGCAAAHGATWFPLGPYGGDARAFGVDPTNSRHLYLGTTTGWIYQSQDGGATWARVARLGTSDDLVTDHILVDPQNPKRLIVGAYYFDRPDGGIYISDNGGESWYAQAQMRGQSVRSMARSESDPSEVAAGTLQGVFLSHDNGTHWQQISPVGSTEIHEVESLAIDPKDPNVIYAGTWHLPWKTEDGGANWTSIKQGIIEDSDVFSIIVDPLKPNIVYASACSGIYKSTSGGAEFVKIPPKTVAIPSSARRTRKLLQDPADPQIVFAGTTEGLYRTANGGASFTRTTAADVIVNDVYIDPTDTKRVLIATDRGGVLSSNDGGDTFQPSNTGFSSRRVLAYAADPQNQATLYVGIVNDKQTGGVYQSVDGGVEWTQQSSGLGGRDVFSLVATPAGSLLSGTGHGVFRFDGSSWVDSNEMETSAAAPDEPRPAPSKGTAPATPKSPIHSRAVIRPAVASRRKTAPHATQSSIRVHRATANSHTKASTRSGQTAVRRVATTVSSRRSVVSGGRAAPPLQQARALHLAPAPQREAPAAAPASARMDAVVYGLTAVNDSVLAATSAGLLRSSDDGHHWAAIASLSMPQVELIAGQKAMLLAGDLRHLSLSMDSGATWDSIAFPSDLTQLKAIAIDELGNLWVGGPEGVFYSTDYGVTWKTLRNMYTTMVDSIYFDAENHRVLVTTAGGTLIFAAHLPDYKVTFWDSGWHLRFVRPVGDHLIGATLYDGMVLQPQMVPEGEKTNVTPAVAAGTKQQP